jgi:hypothetical protein
VTAAEAKLQRALELLREPRPGALAEAHRAAQDAVEAVPYPWKQPHCNEYRQRMQSPTCVNPTCTRCAAAKAGEDLGHDR